MDQGTPELCLAVASIDAEREAIYRFRYEVYVEGLQRPARRADHARRLLREDIDAVSRLAYASASGAVVGVFRSTTFGPALLASPLARIFKVDAFAAAFAEEATDVVAAARERGWQDRRHHGPAVQGEASPR